MSDGRDRPATGRHGRHRRAPADPYTGDPGQGRDADQYPYQAGHDRRFPAVPGPRAAPPPDAYRTGRAGAPSPGSPPGPLPPGPPSGPFQIGAPSGPFPVGPPSGPFPVGPPSGPFPVGPPSGPPPEAYARPVPDPYRHPRNEPAYGGHGGRDPASSTPYAGGYPYPGLSGPPGEHAIPADQPMSSRPSHGAVREDWHRFGDGTAAPGAPVSYESGGLRGPYPHASPPAAPPGRPHVGAGPYRFASGGEQGWPAETGHGDPPWPAGAFQAPRPVQPVPWQDHGPTSGPFTGLPGAEDDLAAEPAEYGGYDAHDDHDGGGYGHGRYGDRDGYGDQGSYDDATGYDDPGSYDDRDGDGRAGYGGPGVSDEPGGDEPGGWADGDSGPIFPVGKRQPPRRRAAPRPRRRIRRRGAPMVALLVLAVFLAGGGVAGYHFLRQYVIPPDYSGSGYGSVMVEIKQGQTATDVARGLFELGVVASPRAFVKAVEQSSQQTALEPGFYRLHRHMKASLAFALLLSPKARIQLQITIPEGLRLSQILDLLAAKSGIPAADFRRAVANPGSLGLPSYARGKPEGYLFPATYAVQPQTTAAGILQAMAQQFGTEAAKLDLVATAQRVNLTPGDAVIVASLLQAEGGQISDFPKIARVIYNRLDAGMPLQLDSTVMYALNTYGILATDQQLKTPSAYNTYMHTGLPPGPIDSPGAAALDAALHPAKGNWLYFVTVDPKTRRTEFTSSYAQFLQLRAELQKNLGQGG